uniref:Ig-like domain-containing protein n=1 Tax=Xiphophorus couchianus TaxID=32473 RepID=A0A3B5M842_9TELE
YFRKALYTIVTATAGHEVVLPCKDPDKGRLTVAEWRRLDLGSRYVLLYRNKQIDPANQHPSFKNRVDLLTNQMYNGDASLILENASITDSGMFECQIVHANSEKKTILTVNLDVLPPPAPPTPPPPPGEECLWVRTSSFLFWISDQMMMIFSQIRLEVKVAKYCN